MIVAIAGPPPAHSEAHVKLLCFFIGAFHMSMARAWRAGRAGG